MTDLTLPPEFEPGACFTCRKQLTMSDSAHFMMGHMYLLTGVQPNPRQPGEYRFHMLHVGSGAKIVFEYDFSCGSDKWLQSFSKIQFPIFFT